jgi:hypothetical protein
VVAELVVVLHTLLSLPGALNTDRQERVTLGEVFAQIVEDRSGSNVLDVDVHIVLQEKSRVVWHHVAIVVLNACAVSANFSDQCIAIARSLFGS